MTTRSESEEASPWHPGRHTFNILCRMAGGTSGRGTRERTRSHAPHGYRGTHGHVLVADGSRGWSLVRGGHRSARARELSHREEEAEWERRRSRSPMTRSHQCSFASPAHDVSEGDTGGHNSAGSDIGAQLLSGSLSMAEGAPSPLVLHPDLMMEFYKNLCGDELPVQQELVTTARTRWLRRLQPCVVG
jgi:hypothetical protein